MTKCVYEFESISELANQDGQKISLKYSITEKSLKFTDISSNFFHDVPIKTGTEIWLDLQTFVSLQKLGILYKADTTFFVVSFFGIFDGNSLKQEKNFLMQL